MQTVSVSCDAKSSEMAFAVDDEVMVIGKNASVIMPPASKYSRKKEKSGDRRGARSQEGEPFLPVKPPDIFENQYTQPSEQMDREQENEE